MLLAQPWHKGFRQPVGSRLVVDLDHPLANGLIAAVVVTSAGGARELTQGVDPDIAPSVIDSPYGYARQDSATRQVWKLGGLQPRLRFDSDARLSIVSGVNALDSDRSIAALQAANGTGGIEAQFHVWDTTTSSFWFKARQSGNHIGSAIKVAIAVWDIYLWQVSFAEGTNRFSGGSQVDPFTNGDLSASDANWNTDTTDVVGAGSGVDQSFFYIWDRYIDLDQYRWIKAEPYAFVVPEAIRLFSFAKPAAGGPVLVSRSDALSLGLGDASGLLGILGRSDDALTALTEGRSIFVTLSRPDSASVVISGAASPLVALSPTDSVSVSLQDTRLILALLSRDETLNVAMQGIASIFGTLARNDSLSVALADAGSLLFQLLASDDCTLALDDAASIYNALMTGDATTVDIADAATVLGMIAVADALSLSAAGTVSLFGTLTTGDSADLSLTEAVALMVSLVASDAVSVATGGATTLFVLVSSSGDAIALTLDELASAVGLTGPDFVPGNAFVWSAEALDVLFDVASDGVEWSVVYGAEGKEVVETLTKQPDESRVYDFDFTNKLIAGATLVGNPAPEMKQLLDDAVTADLDLGVPSVNSPRVQVRIAGGVNGNKYKVSCVATDSDGNVLEADGYLKIKD